MTRCPLGSERCSSHRRRSGPPLWPAGSAEIQPYGLTRRKKAARRRCETTTTASSGLLRRCFEELQRHGPAARTLDRRAHRLHAGAVATEVAMLEVDARRSVGLRREAHLDFARFREFGLVLPRRRDLPRHDEASRRLPHQNAAPVAFRVVDLFAVAPPPPPPLPDVFFPSGLSPRLFPRGPPIVSPAVST